eukprot:2709999-Rhodomonas_salina.2
MPRPQSLSKPEICVYIFQPIKAPDMCMYLTAANGWVQGRTCCWSARAGTTSGALCTLVPTKCTAMC